jgi:hypothetical protein
LFDGDQATNKKVHLQLRRCGRDGEHLPVVFFVCFDARASPVVVWRWDGQLWVEGGEEGAYGAGNFNYDGIVHCQNGIQFG